jgi:hypothetical protein
LAAASEVKPPPDDLSELTAEQIRRLAEQNRAAIEHARKALQMESRVSVKPTKLWDDQHEEDVKRLRRLAVALGVESRAQLLNQHTNEAACCGLDTLRLAEFMRKGGLITDGIQSLVVKRRRGWRR